MNDIHIHHADNKMASLGNTTFFRANVYCRPTGYYIKNPHRADGKAACQQKKRLKEILSFLKAS